MPIVAGADGCRAGWLCIARDLETGALSSGVYATAQPLIHQTPLPEILTIDIPIGLSEIGPRSCDMLARRVLKKRGCCVFPAPIRPVLVASNQAEASALRWAIERKRVSAQAAAIVPKVREIDSILLQEIGLQSRVREVHPEVCFTAWNSRAPIPERKRSPEGAAKRRALITDHFGLEAFVTIRNPPATRPRLARVSA